MDGCVPLAILLVIHITATSSADLSEIGEEYLRFPRNVGGETAKPHSWPWQALLLYDGNFICGGSLIGGGGSLIESRHIVTAAHCVDDRNAQRYRVVLGAHNRLQLEPSARTFNVSRIIVHSNYKQPSRYSNDVAVLRLADSVRFNHNIQPIRLASHDRPAGKYCYLTGWGDSQAGLGSDLRQVRLRLVGNVTCHNYFRNRRGEDPIDNSMMCAGYPSRSGCQGDSGGPLACQAAYQEYELQGIVSWGRKASPYCGTNVDRPAEVLARVPALRRWICQNADMTCP